MMLLPILLLLSCISFIPSQKVQIEADFSICEAVGLSDDETCYTSARVFEQSDIIDREGGARFKYWGQLFIEGNSADRECSQSKPYCKALHHYYKCDIEGADKEHFYNKKPFMLVKSDVREKGCRRLSKKVIVYKGTVEIEAIDDLSFYNLDFAADIIPILHAGILDEKVPENYKLKYYDYDGELERIFKQIKGAYPRYIISRDTVEKRSLSKIYDTRHPDYCLSAFVLDYDANDWRGEIDASINGLELRSKDAISVCVEVDGSV